MTLPPVQVRQSALLRYRGSICLAGAIPQSARAGQGTTTPTLVRRHARAKCANAILDPVVARWLPAML